MEERERKKRNEGLLKKIEKMYQNYGLDISNMDDDEFDRMLKYYSDYKVIDLDLKKSEKFKDKYSDDTV